MQHFKLNLKAGILSSDIRRKYQEVELEIEENCEFIEEISLQHGRKVTKLTCHAALTFASKRSSSCLLRILRNFPLLSELHLHKLNIVFEKTQRISFPHLKTLKIADSSLDLLNVLSSPSLESFELSSTSCENDDIKTFLQCCPQLETLIFRNDGNYFKIFNNCENLPFNLRVLEVTNDGNAHMDGLEDILSKFSNLKVLIISCGMIGNVMFPEPKNIPFRLTKLDHTLWSPYIGQIINENYCAFLRTQKDNLKEVSTVSLFPDTVEIDDEYLVLFTEMKVLEKLSFDLKNSFPKNEQFYQDLQPIPTVKELRFTHIKKSVRHGRGFESRHRLFLRKVLPLFPNLELFECFYPLKAFPDLMTILSKNNPKLKSLSLWCVKNYEPENKFNFLETFNFKVKENIDNFQAFANDHPRVTMEKSSIHLRSYNFSYDCEENYM